MTEISLINLNLPPVKGTPPSAARHDRETNDMAVIELMAMHDGS